MTALQAYVLAKKIAESAATGISSITADQNILTFTLKDGQQINMEVPLPKDGVSVVSLDITSDNHLECKMSDNTIIDAGVLPSGGGTASMTWKKF